VGALAVGVATWWIGVVSADVLREPLRRPTLWLAHSLLRLVSTDAFVDAPKFVFGADGFLVHLSPECSGFDGVGLIAALTGAHLWLSRRRLRFPQAFALPVIGVVAVWLLNAVRLAVLVWIGASVSERFARGGFHSLAGLIAFCGVALWLIVGSRRSRMFAKDPAAPDASPWASPSAAWLGPLLAYLGAGLLLDGLLEDPDSLYFLRPLAALGVAGLQRRRLPRLEWRSVSALAAFAGVAACAAYVVPEWLSTLGEDAPKPLASSATAPSATAPSALWMATRGVGYVFITPWIEELAFRGYLMRRLTRAEFEEVRLPDTSTAAWLATSLAFGWLHQDLLRATVAGLAFGWAARRTGRLADAVLAHAVATGLLFVAAAALGNWDLLG